MNHENEILLFVSVICINLPLNPTWVELMQHFSSRVQLGPSSVWFRRADASEAVLSLLNVTQELLHIPLQIQPSPRLCRQGFTGTPLQNHRQQHVCALWISGTCCKHYSLRHPSQTKSSHLPIIRCLAHPEHKDVGRACLARGKVVASEKTPEEIVTMTDTQTGQRGWMKHNVLKHSLPVTLTKREIQFKKMSLSTTDQHLAEHSCYEFDSFILFCGTKRPTVTMRLVSKEK